MNASRVAIQLKVLIATFLPDLLLSMTTNNCRCQSHAASLTPLPRFPSHSAACCGHLKHCLLSVSFFPCSLVRLERPMFLGADLPMAAPAYAAEVNPLPQAAATGGAEPRATHPENAPKAPGWVSMASGVDGASMLVSFAQIGECVR